MGVRGQAEDTHRARRQGQLRIDWQGNQLQLVARTATETETEICQTSPPTIKTEPQELSDSAAAAAIKLDLISESPFQSHPSPL